MTSISQEAIALEKRIKALDLSVAFVCRRARITPGCWSHWRNGKRAPLQKNWEDVIAEVEYLEQVLG